MEKDDDQALRGMRLRLTGFAKQRFGGRARMAADRLPRDGRKRGIRRPRPARFNAETIRKWQRGTRKPSALQLVRFAQTFEVSLDWLLLGKARTEAEESAVRRLLLDRLRARGYLAIDIRGALEEMQGDDPASFVERIADHIAQRIEAGKERRRLTMRATIDAMRAPGSSLSDAHDPSVIGLQIQGDRHDA